MTPSHAYYTIMVEFDLTPGSRNAFMPLMLAPGLVEGEGGVAFWGLSIAVLLVACTAWALTLGRGPLERVTAWAARKIDAPG